jgi:hypothetical protein
LTSCEEYLSRENTRRKAMEILRIVSRFLSAKEVLQRVSTSFIIPQVQHIHNGLELEFRLVTHRP